MTAARRRLHPLPTEQPVPPELVLFVKRCAEVDGEVLEREAEVLRELDGRPVVELVDCRTVGGQVELRTLGAGSSTLADAAGLPPRTVLRAAAAACRSVVSLHRAGWGHGAVTPDHVVVGGRGRATLCSLGHAQPLVAAPELVTVDRSGTFGTLLHVADELEVEPADRARRRAAQVLRRAVGPADQDLLDVAAAIEADLAGRHERRRPPTRAGLVAGGALAAATLLAGAWTWTGQDDRSTEDLTARTVPAPGSTAPRSPGRISVGATGDEHVEVDLDCDGDDELLVLRPSTGELFVAPRIPEDDRPVRTVPAGTLPGATTLTTSTAAGRCAVPLATMSDGSTVPVELGATSGPSTTKPTASAPPPTSMPVARGATEPGASTTARAQPLPQSTGDRPARSPSTTRPDRRPITPATPYRPAPTTTEPPYEYPVADTPLPTPDPSEEPA